ncbi:hypothetical protein DFQ28_003616 [Apophysomyces sp. BC1034]|nr:hypothetical protein DFQ30_006407 [Apophysomyces sp. BC1015]KAG0179165.1 hypothetical protein DFQ29_002452 [Apophysomyces sp. BC1021]KAG0189268.1 hypothetical protein DFQ28_003616 [Apophysomyces sp. BC1034]
MVHLVTVLSLLAVAGVSTAAPTGGVPITVKNSCSYSVQVKQLTNGGSGGQSSTLSAGSSTEISVPSNWGGRIWGHKENDESTNAASLAEFLLRNPADGSDYYDVSFVDGYNLPMSIAPNGQSADSSNGYICGTPSCAKLPTCPSDSEVKDSNGNVVGCQSSCRDCTSSRYADTVGASCPDVYAYSTDDTTSMFACKASGYTVTFCP